jgi:DNA-binding winged helix-turn-helix (wHTH) protein
LSDRLEAPRPRRFVIVEDAGAFAELVEEWLASHGLMAVPIDDAQPSPAAIGVGPGPDESAGPPDGLPRSNGHGADAHGSGSLADAADHWIMDRLGSTRLEGPEIIAVGPLEIDTGRLEVRVGGVDVHLTPTEFRLLLHLAEHPDRVAGHHELLTQVWGRGYEDDVHLLQVTIRSLRARIALVTGLQIIETVYGAGYRIASFEATSPGRGD